MQEQTKREDGPRRKKEKQTVDLGKEIIKFIYKKMNSCAKNKEVGKVVTKK
jgi:hypothetical protein